MNAVVEFPSALQKYVNNQKTVAVQAGTVKQVFAALVSKHDGLKAQLFDDQGRIRSFVNIYVNDEDIRHGKNLDTEIKSGDVVQIVPSIAGGCGRQATLFLPTAARNYVGGGSDAGSWRIQQIVQNPVHKLIILRP